MLLLLLSGVALAGLPRPRLRGVIGLPFCGILVVVLEIEIQETAYSMRGV